MSSSLLNLDLKNLKLPRWLSLHAPAEGSVGLRIKYPPVAMDMGTSHFVLARLARDKEKKRWTLASYDAVPVPEDLVDSEFFRLKIRSTDQFRGLVSRTVGKGGVRTDKISLVLPDHLARVALLPFEELPRSRREVIEMLRWKMRKAVPFKVDEAVVDYQVFPVGTGFSVLAVLMPQGILEEHESVFADQGIHPGLVDLSTFSLAHLYRGVAEAEVPEGGDFMLLNATGTFFTVMIFRAGRPIFYRCKTFAFVGEIDSESAPRLIHREAQASILYYQERLAGQQLARVYMRLVGHDASRVASLFDDAPVASRPELIDLRRVVDVDGRISALGSDRAAEILQRLAPAVGAALGREA